GLAARVGYTPRHLHPLPSRDLGAGPLALARAPREPNAPILLETTATPVADGGLAAGFASIRQFNDTVREVYASTPTQLRGRSRHAVSTTGRLHTGLPGRAAHHRGGARRPPCRSARRTTGRSCCASWWPTSCRASRRPGRTGTPAPWP